MVDQPPKRDQLRHLRDILVGPTDERLDQLRQQVEQRDLSVERISRDLPEAIRQSAHRDEKLARALGPTLERSFEASVKRDPKALADIIAPILGPAIRRSITQTIQAMVQSLNTTLEHSLSPQGWKWRVEAWRTGKPFGEVVLLHTLLYRTEQLLLIDRRTGLLMQSVSATPDDDADLVSAMLTAIQDFMHESFDREGRETNELDTMTSGNLTIWLAHGSLAYLAVAIRGEPPLDLRETLQQAIEQIHVEYRDLLLGFAGDPAPLEVLRPDMEACLETKFVGDRRREQQAKASSRLVWVVPTVFLLASFLLGGAYWWRVRWLHEIASTLDIPPTATFQLHQNVVKLRGAARSDWIHEARNRLDRLPGIDKLDVADVRVLDADWVEFQRLLRESPGIVVTMAQRNGDHFVVHGLRDPLAVEPAELLRQAGLSASRVQQQWQPYQCLDVGLSFKRIQRQLGSLPSVRLAVESGRLIARGQAPASWIRQLEQAASLLGIEEQADFSELVAADPAWAYFLRKVAAEPGLEILKHEQKEDRFFIFGRRDALAPDPVELLRTSNVPVSLVTCRFDPFVSLDPIIVERRVRELLDPPETVFVEVTAEGIVRVTGQAERGWIQRLARLRPIEGTTEFDLSGLVEMDEGALPLRAVRPQ